MAINLTEKRQRIARNTISGGTSLLDAANGLAIAKLERAQSDNFIDAEFESQADLVHVDAFIVGLTLDTLVTELNTWLDAKINNDNDLPTRRELLLKLRR